ncbi:hypothetical protein [Marinoscillum sp. MHG1-6]|uniref:hypothetical protein n=1 Tax=Marinoscillum sp. MHG1-6 TaxID=2959627 RepID=UPI00215774F9|nr:hypothetical protein [Marinoscillum sp. MHG1-6]
MKNLRYISAQGWHAPSFRFKNHSAHQFRSLIEAMTLNQALLVSSMYRTDLLYFSEKNMNKPILKVWCLLTGNNYTDSLAQKLLTGQGDQEVFELYFDSMSHLKLHDRYYKRYKTTLNEIFHLEPSNIILQELTQCDRFLARMSTKSHDEETLIDHPNERLAQPSMFHFIPLCNHYIRKPFDN